jgi:hypothetical protein
LPLGTTKLIQAMDEAPFFKEVCAMMGGPVSKL